MTENSQEPQEKTSNLNNHPEYLDLLYDDIYSGRFVWCELIRLIYRFCMYIYSFFIENANAHDSLPDVSVSETVIKQNPVDIYIENEKKRFLQFIDVENKNEQLACKINGNVDKLFYDIDGYKKHLENPDNDLEQKWKKNILMESTPRGNVIMYYDPFKMGFSYFSNESVIHYNILNAIAMKYVRIFSCADLFFDTSVTPFNSPLIEVFKNDKTDVTASQSESTTKKVSFKIETKNAPFAKFKNYKNGEEKTGKGNPENNTKVFQRNMNKFIHLGKTNNFNILQKSPIKYTSLFAGKSSYDTIFENENNLQKEVISYRDFKTKVKKQELDKQD